MKRWMLLFLLIFTFFLSEISQAQSNFSIGEVRILRSEKLNEERILNVYLPQSYKLQDSLPYPVLYLLDGSANEDFIHVCGLTQFLSMYKLMPEVIVVGISNVDRKRDFTFPTTIEKDKTDFPTTGGSEKFMAFLKTELVPFINKEYKVSDDRLLLGQSLGGLLAAEVFYTYPDLFSKYVIISPSFWWNGQSLLKQLDAKLKSDYTPSGSVFVAVGKEHPVMIKDAKKLASILKSKQSKNFKTGFAYLPGEDHATVMHEAAYQALRFLYKK